MSTLAVSGGSSNNEFHIVKDLGVHGDINVSGSVFVGAGVTIADIAISHSSNAFIFGSASNNTITHQMTGNLALSASTGITVNMPANTVGFVGTASFAETSSHAVYASSSISSSYADFALSSSSSISSSYASTSSTSDVAITGGLDPEGLPDTVSYF